MSIADIFPDILSECGVDNPAPSVTDDDFETRQFLALMNAAGNDISTRTEWSRAMRTAEITADGADLPDDYQKLEGAGAVSISGSAYSPARPITDPITWQFMQKNVSAQNYYHMRNAKIYFLPVLDGTASLRYISKNWVNDGDADEITQNTDTLVFPERLLTRGTIWRWRRQKGLPYEDLMAEFEADLEAAVKADRGVM